jgi:hypothetical protein
MRRVTTSPPDDGSARAPSPPGQGADARAEVKKALPLQLELPAPAAPGAKVAPAAPRKRRGAGRVVVRVVAAVVAIVALGAVAVVFVLPWYVRRACVESAASHGIALAIDDVRVDASGFRLVGVSAHADAIPGVLARAATVHVETSGLTPRKLTALGAELTLEGRWSTVADAFAKWRASPVGGEGGAWAPATLVVEGAHVAWTAPVSDDAHIDATHVHMELSWGGGDVEMHARSDGVNVAFSGGALGPWRVDIDRTPGSSRVRIALDPGVPDSCTVLVVADQDRTTQVDVIVPRSPLARLGVPPRLIGLRGKDLQAEATIHYDALGASRSRTTAKGAVYGIESAGLPRPLDVSFEGEASGDPAAGLDVKRARLAAGPLVGALTGTVKTFDDGFRVDLGWSAGPVPCAAFDAPLAEGQPFDIAYQLRKLAEATGLTQLTGDVRATGTLALDSRDLGGTALTFSPQTTCSLKFF